MALRKGKNPRRREVRRNIATERKRPWQEWLSRGEVVWPTVWVLLIVLGATFTAYVGQSLLPYRIGQTINRPILARVSFDAIDQEKTQRDIQAEMELVPGVYDANATYFARVRTALKDLVLIAADPSIDSLEKVPEQTRKNLELTEASLPEMRKFVDQGKPTQQWVGLVDQFMAGMVSNAVLGAEDFARERERRQQARGIMIRVPGESEEQRRPDELLISVKDTETIRSRLNTWLKRFPTTLQPSIAAVMMSDVEPYYLFDPVTTQQRKDAVRQDPSLVAMRTYKADAVLLETGTKLDNLSMALIQAERDAYDAQRGMLQRTANRIAIALTMLLVAIAMWTYLLTYYPRVAQNPMRGLAITALILVCQIAPVTLTALNPQFVYATAVFAPLFAAIVLAIAYDQRMALAIGLIQTLLVIFSLELGVGFGMVLLTGLIVAVTQLREVRTRSKLVLVGLYTGLAMAMVMIMVGVMYRPLHVGGEWTRILRDAALVLSTGFVAGLFVQGILPGIEKFFKVTTAMTLKELNDASHPLLRLLAETAPGTYQHSLRIADMAEAAADRIGANGLLCRVGAMYHDIGKTNKPQYFVENQGGGPNRHDKLSPAMSLLIIVGHVKDGIEMAREYGLPPVVRHFIESHHGTTLVEYFYHAAKQKQEAADGTTPAEFEFRYPGPKPQTREAAILLLCDGIEGASRTLPDPTPIRIEQLVHQMANKRLMDGQFNECNLTLNELHTIEASITKILCAIYHARIKYPSADKPTNKPAAEPASATAAS